MGRSQETFNKKEVRNKKEKKRKEKEKKRLERKETSGTGSLNDMIAYVDEYGVISNTPPDPSNKTIVDMENILVSTPKKELTEDDNPIRKGTVTFFNHGKGFGFIKDSISGESIFVHASQVDFDILEGNAVNFEIERGPKGLTAVNVTKLKQ